VCQFKGSLQISGFNEENGKARTGNGSFRDSI
jgi:hypothetical protein